MKAAILFDTVRIMEPQRRLLELLLSGEAGVRIRRVVIEEHGLDESMTTDDRERSLLLKRVATLAKSTSHVENRRS